MLASCWRIQITQVDSAWLQVFTGSGQTITTRAYRGVPPPGDTGIDFVAFGGVAEIERMAAWELEGIWHHKAKMPVRGCLC